MFFLIFDPREINANGDKPRKITLGGCCGVCVVYIKRTRKKTNNQQPQQINRVTKKERNHRHHHHRHHHRVTGTAMLCDTNIC